MDLGARRDSKECNWGENSDYEWSLKKLFRFRAAFSCDPFEPWLRQSGRREMVIQLDAAAFALG